MKIERTRRGARIVADDVVLSEILDHAGATHSLFDLLAAAVATLSPGPRFAMLGFAGGGMVAPLRALGCDFPVHAVDLDLGAETLFRELSDGWAGDVHLDKADAGAWLAKRRGKFDAIVEDLSVPSPVGTVKPYVSLDLLPQRIRSRLGTGGVVITNLLPLPGTSWDALYACIANPYLRAVVVHLDDYENRVMIAGDAIPDAREISKRLRTALKSIESDLLRQLRLKTLRFT